MALVLPDATVSTVAAVVTAEVEAGVDLVSMSRILFDTVMG